MLLAYLAFAVLCDEQLDPGLKEFFADQRQNIPDRENAAIGLLGLGAPAGEDIFVYGKRLQDLQLANFTNTVRGLTAPMAAEAPKLPLIDDAHVVDCYFQASDDKAIQACASLPQLESLIGNNQELLYRLKEISTLNHFQDSVVMDGMFALNVIKLARVSIDLKLTKGNIEDAYQDWRQIFQFIERTSSGDSNAVGKAILSVAEEISLSELERMLFSRPDLATTHGDELRSMLNQTGLARWNLHSSFASAYRAKDNALFLLKPTLFLHKNFIRNRMYRAIRDISTAIETSAPSDIENNCTKVWRKNGAMNEWSSDYIRDPLTTFPSRLVFVDDFGKFGELAINFLHRDNMKRILIADILLRQQKIPDESVNAFIANLGPTFRDPFTGKAMTWDSHKRTISFINGTNSSGFEARL